jgi:sterol 3beta-glucosyltransferase/vancomycin aglycone glucosyltransferase
LRIGLQTWGSDGDIRPFVALGAGLVRRGHQVTLAIGSVDEKEYGPMCAAVGVRSLRAPERMGLALASWMVKFGATRNPLKMVRLLHEEALFPSFPEMMTAARALAREHDVLVGHFLAAPLKIAALQAQKPHASVGFWPGLAPDPARAPDGLPSLGRGLNRCLWWAGFRLLDRAVGDGYRALYQSEGLPPPGGVPEATLSPQLDLLACSPLLWPEASDRSGPTRFTGYWHTPAAAEPEPLPQEVEEFLSRGAPPLFLTLGSSAAILPDECERLLVQTAEATGLRAIVQLLPGRARPQASERVCFVGRTSHSALLPRCAASLHHGGAGNTHTTLAAGRPAVVAGFMDEQSSWGRRLVKHGVGGGVFRIPGATPVELSRALVRVAGDAAMRARAEALGARLRAEDGVAAAVEAIEALGGAQLAGTGSSARR